MFGRNKKEAPAPPRRKGAELMAQMGIGDIEQQLYGDLDDDEDLEAELLALQGKPPPKKKTKGKGQVSASEFDQMIADSMKDLDDEEISDTEDPDLLDELQELQEDGSEPSSPSVESPKSVGSSSSMVSVLTDRLENYKTAAQSAQQAGDSSKKRRLDRGVKTIEDLLKKAKQGKTVDEDDIPPQVAVTTTKKAPPTQPAQPSQQRQAPPPIFEPTISSGTPEPAPRPLPVPRKQAPAPPQPQSSESESSDDSKTKAMLEERRDQYKRAALAAKHSGDMSTAGRYVKIAKQFDNVIKAVNAGQPIDLSQMPPPPPQTSATKTHTDQVPTASISRAQREQIQQGSSNVDRGADNSVSPVAPPPPSEEDEKDLFQAPEPPKTIMEALVQRLQKYQGAEKQAKDEGNGSKARRMGRIAKQYQDAIKSVKAGRAVDFDELPTPPGYAPIPVQQTSPSKPTPSPSGSASNLQAPAGRGQPQGQRSPKPAPRSPQPQPQQKPTPAPAVAPQSAKQANFKRSPSSRIDQQTQFLKERMLEYKQAAVNAKKNNDIPLARKYLRMAKGFEPMIEATESGLPVDLTQVPPSLSESVDEPSFLMVSQEDCELSGDREEVFQKLEQDIISQIRMCSANYTHFSKLGDVVNANKFQKMEKSLQKDLDALKNALRHNDPVPKFHYENRTFSIVQCNTDLGDSDIEIVVVRGVQYNPPSGYSEKDLDTYVKLELPFPNDEPQTGQSETVKGSFNPEYNEPIKMSINRKSRALVRVIERKAIKLEVYYKRGLFKSDKVLGTVNVKLAPLETLCTVHDSYDLTDGRKSVGGKLEVKVRIRDPFKSKQVEEVKEKWLVIDQFIKTIANAKSKAKPVENQQKNRGSTCMEVLKYEKQQLDKQISALRDSLSATQLSALTSKSKLLQEKVDQQAASLKSGGVNAWKEYVKLVESDVESFHNEARQLAQHGDMQKAQLMLTKKKLAEKEVKSSSGNRQKNLDNLLESIKKLAFTSCISLLDRGYINKATNSEDISHQSKDTEHLDILLDMNLHLTN